MIGLICIDVDGTLVGQAGTVDPRVWRAAEQARTAGLRLALCSGRPAFATAKRYAERLDGEGWHCFQNGASVVHLGDGRSHSMSLPDEAVAALVAYARESGGILELYADDEYVCESAGEWAYAHAALLGVSYAPRPFEALRKPVVRAQWLASAQEVSRLPTPADLERAHSTSPVMAEVVFVGMTRRGVTKASAVRSIAGEYGVALEEVMYVGDALNDLAAMQIVGLPIAMANAAPEVLQAARHVVGHVDDAGLTQAIDLAIEQRRR